MNNNKINQITFLRFIAAVWVLVLHYYPWESSDTLNKNIMSSGWLGVPFFFTLSGFVLVYTYHNRNDFIQKIKTINFYIFRLIRLYPLYLLAFYIDYLILTINASDTQLKIQVQEQVVLNIFVIQSWFLTFFSTNGPSWSISTEFFFYSIFPNLMKRIRSNKQIIIFTSLALLFWIVLQTVTILYEPTLALSKKLNAIFAYNPIINLPSFLIGMVSAFIYFSMQPISRYGKNILGIIFCCISIFTLYCITAYHLYPVQFYFQSMLSPVFALLIVGLSIQKNIITKFLSLKPFVFLGEVSFAIYILQTPIFHCYMYIKNTKEFGLEWIDIITKPSTQAEFLSFATVLILVSLILHIFFEKPIYTYAKKKYSTQPNL